MNEISAFPSTDLAHDIERYTVAVDESQRWLVDQEISTGLFFSATPEDPEYPERLRRMRDKIARYQGVLARLLQQNAEEEAASAAAPESDVIPVVVASDTNDRAAALVEAVIRSTIRPGAPLPYLEIVEAKNVRGKGKASDGAEAELVMFDGRTARFECENWVEEPDAYRSTWSRLEGGAIMLEDGRWRRVEEVEAASKTVKLDKLMADLEKFSARAKELARLIDFEEERYGCYSVSHPLYSPVAQDARHRLSDVNQSTTRLLAAIERESGPEVQGPSTNPNAIGEKLIAAGLADGKRGGNIALNLWQGDTPAPSRLYRAPVAYLEANSFGSDDGVYLIHEALRDHPQARLIAQAVGYELPLWEDGMFGSFSGSNGRWHHASDLMQDEYFEHLLDTQHLTKDGAIEVALVNTLWGAESGQQISIANARKVMNALGVPEPEDRSVSRIFGVGKHRGFTSESSENVNARRFTGAGWMLIHAIEDKRMARKGQFLQFSPETLATRIQKYEEWEAEWKRKAA